MRRLFSNKQKESSTPTTPTTTCECSVDSVSTSATSSCMFSTPFEVLAEKGRFDDILNILKDESHDNDIAYREKLIAWLNGSGGNNHHHNKHHRNHNKNHSQNDNDNSCDDSLLSGATTSSTISTDSSITGNNSSNTKTIKNNTHNQITTTQRTKTTALHKIMSYQPTVDVVDMLCKKLRKIHNDNEYIVIVPEDIVDENGCTPLHIAAMNGCDNSIIIRLLYGGRANPAVTMDIYGRTPLHWACTYKPISTCTSNILHIRKNKKLIDNAIKNVQCIVSAYPHARLIRDNITGLTPEELVIMTLDDTDAEDKFIKLLHPTQKQLLRSNSVDNFSVDDNTDDEILIDECCTLDYFPDITTDNDCICCDDDSSVSNISYHRNNDGDNNKSTKTDYNNNDDIIIIESDYAIVEF